MKAVKFLLISLFLHPGFRGNKPSFSGLISAKEGIRKNSEPALPVHALTDPTHAPEPHPENDSMTRKTIPEAIRTQAEKALSYYPELKDTPITFKFKKRIKKSTMQAQPKFSGIFRRRGKRAYVILISETIQIEDESFHILDLEDEIMIGWLGHELGHIMDYRERTGIGMLIFGFRYLYSRSYLREAERTADAFAIEKGMGDYIIATKNFILNHSDISEVYKDRIRRLYLSPEEIMEMVNTMDEGEIREEIEEEIKAEGIK